MVVFHYNSQSHSVLSCIVETEGDKSSIFGLILKLVCFNFVFLHFCIADFGSWINLVEFNIGTNHLQILPGNNNQ